MCRLVVVLGAVVVASCSGDTPAAPLPTAAAVKIQASAGTDVIIDDTLALKALVTDSAGRSITGKAVTWTTSPSQAESQPGSATIDALGRLVGVTSGWIWVRASADAQADSVHLRVRARGVFDVPTSSTSVAVGASATINITIRDSSGRVLPSAVAFAVTSSDSTIVAVENLGTNPLAYFGGISFDLHGEREGSATISVTVDSVTKTFDVQVFTVRFSSIVPGNGFVSSGFFCGLTSSATALCWGDNQWGQLGSPTPPACRGSAGQYCATYGPSATPLPVAGGLQFRALSLGGNVACGITPGDDAYCWGAGGSLGSNATLGSCGDAGYYNSAFGACSASPVPVAGQIKFRGLAVTSGQVCGVARSGAGYCWGIGVAPLPTAVAPGFAFDTIVPGGNVASVDPAGNLPTCGLTSDGKAYCWSSPSFGQSPTPVTGVPALSAIGASGLTDCGLSQAGQVYCWKGDLQANLVQTDERFRSLSVAYTSACGLTDAGIAYCWDVDSPAAAPAALPNGATGPIAFASIRTGYWEKSCGMGRDGIAYCEYGTSAPSRVAGQP